MHFVDGEQTNDLVEPADFVIGMDRKLNDGTKGPWSAHHFSRHDSVTIRIARLLARVFLHQFIRTLAIGVVPSFVREMFYTPASDRYQQIQYPRCGHSGLKLPEISLGLWHNFGDVDDFENARAMVH
jgi:hypothetical protein